MKFGFIGFGEVSYTLSKILLELGFDVLTSLEGRSEESNRLANSLNLRILDSFEELSQKVDVLISANSPKIALNVAKEYACLTNGIFLDFNNISPDTVLKIEEMIGEEHFIDSAIFGRVNSNELNIYLSGKNAQKLLNDIENEIYSNFCETFGDLDINSIFKKVLSTKVNIKVLNDNIGDVARLKMLRSIFTKGISALLVESFENAYNLGLGDELWEVLSLTENRDFKTSSKSRIKSSYKSSKRKYEELDQILEFLDDCDDEIFDNTMVLAIREKFTYLNGLNNNFNSNNVDNNNDGDINN